MLKHPFRFLARWLTDNEHHMVQDNYVNALQLKSALFALVNAFAYPLYLLFVAHDLDELLNYLWITMGLKMIIMGSITEIVLPRLQTKLERWWKTRGRKKKHHHHRGGGHHHMKRRNSKEMLDAASGAMTTPAAGSSSSSSAKSGRTKIHRALKHPKVLGHSHDFRNKIQGVFQTCSDDCRGASEGKPLDSAQLHGIRGRVIKNYFLHKDEDLYEEYLEIATSYGYCCCFFS